MPTFEPGASTFTPQTSGGDFQVNSGYSTPTFASKNASGASTPGLISHNGSTTSLSSLASALREIEATPFSELFEAIHLATSSGDVRTAVNNLLEKMEELGGVELVEKYHVAAHVSALSKSKNSAISREGSLMVISSIARKYSHDSEPYLLSMMNVALDLLADKDNNVKRAAQSCLDTIIGTYSAEGRSQVMGQTLKYISEGSSKWQGKLAALKIVDALANNLPYEYVEPQFVDAIPALTAAMHELKPEVAKAGSKTLTDFTAKLDNQDVVPRLPVIIKALADPRTVADCIKTLSHVTFVAEVTAPALAVLVPILTRALNINSSDSLRQTVVVVENLTRLVHRPEEVKGFIPELMPGVKRVVESAAQPEVRDLATKALAVLDNAEKDTSSSEKVTVGAVEAEIKSVYPEFTLDHKGEYYSNLIAITANAREFKKVEEYLSKVIADSEKAAAVLSTIKNRFSDSRDDDESEGVPIVNAEFSLAYGGRMLLNKTILKLFKGHRYGLCGHNGAGKSTLMRSIASGKLEGFPDQSELKTCFVEHKLQGEEGDMDIVSFIASDVELKHVPRDEISSALEEVGFDERRRGQNVGALSGGWKMKLELARAMLMKADILLLDEPTNHLDVTNVKWLEDYLNQHTEITSLIVSHDSGFLDAVCTDIIHYENKKLVYYKGNLSKFVEQYPAGKSYYTLSDSVVKMAFPPPGILTGVRSNTRAVARMTDVTFTYPGTSTPSLANVSCSLSLSSRVAILGPNGAGKSTLIKLLTGELIPNEGTVEKHPNLRIGYIAQHALQHVELHKEKTPNQYLQWRYMHGDDREVHLKQSRIVSDEEKAVMNKPIDLGDGHGPRRVEAIIGRQKLKKTFQYELKWVGSLPKFNSWIPKDTLLEWGFGKLLQRFDDHEASREGLGYRELSPPVIRKHFEDIGLDGDIADHTPLGSLSGGQLVKVVIAGAMWNNPHLLVLDEPTNYLDRDSLGGLAVAIRDWSGGVIMISHNDEFVGALCPEQWIVNDGKVMHKGKSAVASDRFEDGKPGKDDSPANIRARKKKKMTRNELKEREVRRRQRYIDWLNTPKGTPRPPDTDDEEED